MLAVCFFTVASRCQPQRKGDVGGERYTAPESGAWFTQLPFLFTQKGLREAGSTTVQTPEMIVVGGSLSSLNNNTKELPQPSMVWPHPHPCPTLCQL